MIKLGRRIAPAVIGAGLIALAACRKIDNAPRNSTLNTLRMVDAYVGEVEKARGKGITEIIGATTNGNHDYNQALASLIAHNLDPANVAAAKDGKLQLVDAWGHRLLVVTAEDARKLGFPDAAIKDRHLVVWSAGPNGKDEKGGGDDISVDLGQ